MPYIPLCVFRPFTNSMMSKFEQKGAKKISSEIRAIAQVIFNDKDLQQCSVSGLLTRMGSICHCSISAVCTRSHRDNGGTNYSSQYSILAT